MLLGLMVVVIGLFFRNQSVVPIRPFITLEKQSVSAQIVDYPVDVRVKCWFLFRNLGSHPAQNVRVRIGLADRKDMATFKVLYDKVFANRMDPQNTLRVEEVLMEPIDAQRSLNRPNESPALYAYVRLDYQDTHGFKSRFHDELLFVTSVEGKTQEAKAATREDMALLRPYIAKTLK